MIQNTEKYVAKNIKEISHVVEFVPRNSKHFNISNNLLH